MKKDLYLFEVKEDTRLQESLYYASFLVAPVQFIETNELSETIKRFLTEKIKGTSITCVKFQDVHIFQNGIKGVEESISEIVQNLRKIIFRSSTDKISKASIYVRGPGAVLARDIFLPPSLAIENPTEHILSVSELIDFSMDLVLERNPELQEDSNSLTQNDSVCEKNTFHLHYHVKPVKGCNYKLLFHDAERKRPGYILFEVYTSGGVLPTDAFYEAFDLSADFSDFRRKSERGKKLSKNLWIFQDKDLEELKKGRWKILTSLGELKGIEIPFDLIFFPELQEHKIEKILDMIKEDINKKIDDILSSSPDFSGIDEKTLKKYRMFYMKQFYIELYNSILP